MNLSYGFDFESKNVYPKQKLVYGLFVLMFYAPVNNFSVMLG